jgi:glutathione S-transferase
MILYHFVNSPFTRRIRLALAHKNIAVELRDAGTDPAHDAAVDRLHPFQTVPVLVHGERVVCESVAIAAYVDRLQPAPPLWPEGMAGALAVELIALTDATLNILVDAGLRYYPLPEAHRAQAIDRAQRGLEALAQRASGRYLAGEAWSYADMALFTTVHWLEGLPARAATLQNPKQILSLGWTLPQELSRWADQHRARPDVVALG